MAKKQKEEVPLDDSWLESLEKDDKWLESLDKEVTELLDQDGTQKQLRKTLTHSYINFWKGKKIKDGGKIIETIAKIAPAKSDPIESGLEEPVSAVSRADELVLPLEEGEVPVIVSSADMLAEGEKEKLTGSVGEAYHQGDEVVYTKEARHDALEESFEEAVTGMPPSREERYETEKYDPADFEEEPLQEEIDGEIVTEESGLTLDEIRRNMEDWRETFSDYDMPEARRPRKFRSEDSTMSVKEADHALQSRQAALERERRRQKKKVEREARREENRRKWAEQQATRLEEAKRKREEKRQANREAFRLMEAEARREQESEDVPDTPEA